MASDIAEAISQQYLATIPQGRYSDIADPDIIQTLLDATRAGLNPSSACEAAGIHENTFQRWQKRAELEPGSPWDAFCQALKQVRRQGQLVILNRILAASEKPQHWTAGAWLLERADKEQFALIKDESSQQRVVINIGSGSGDVRVLVATEATAEVSLSIGETASDHGVKSLTDGIAPESARVR